MQVEHRTELGRFQVPLPEGIATLEYAMRAPRIMEIESTFVPAAARGRGIGGALVRAALRHAQAEGFEVIPTCWYVKTWVDAHPDYATLLREPPRT